VFFWVISQSTSNREIKENIPQFIYATMHACMHACPHPSTHPTIYLIDSPEFSGGIYIPMNQETKKKN